MCRQAAGGGHQQPPAGGGVQRGQGAGRGRGGGRGRPGRGAGGAPLHHLRGQEAAGPHQQVELYLYYL